MNNNQINTGIRAHQTRRNGFFSILVFLKLPIPAISLWKLEFLSPIIILFQQYSCIRSSHVRKIWHTGIKNLIFNILLQNCLFYSIFIKIFVQHVCFVKGRGLCSSREKMLKFMLDFQKSPRFFPYVNRERSHATPFFTKCGEPLMEWCNGKSITSKQ